MTNIFPLEANDSVKRIFISFKVSSSLSLIKFANDFVMTFDLSNQLDKIKCRLLVIGVENNAYSIPKYDSIPIYETVDGSEFILLDALNKHNEADSLYKIEDEIRKFVESV